MIRPVIAIIGAGFSGTSLALCLQDWCPRGTRIQLIDRDGRFASGPAYATTNPNHLLNVPAGRMGLFPDRPGDFLEWLQQQRPASASDIVPDATSFVSRCRYGEYLRHLLERGCRNTSAAALEFVTGEVVDLDESARGVTLRLASGAVLRADIVVLATGNAPRAPVHADIPRLQAAGVWFNDPWAPATFAGLHLTDSVLIVGCGLTMVDTVISLLDAGHTGPIHALSRHGLLPRRHATPPAAPITLPGPLPDGLRALTRHVRRQIAAAMARGADWRAVIDALRPFTQDLWRGLGIEDRRRFLRHLRCWWDVHRHRMAPQAADRIAALQASNQLRVHAGRIISLGIEAGLATVCFGKPAGGDADVLKVARVIDCTGPGMDLTRAPAPLANALLAAGTARADPLLLGLDVTNGGALLNHAGVPSRRLYAVGPLTRGMTWEITAVPDLRVQCHAVARSVGARLAAGGPDSGEPDSGYVPHGAAPSADEKALRNFGGREINSGIHGGNIEL